MCSASLALNWFDSHQYIALWLEGIALLAIFIWDRIEASQQHDQTLAQMEIMRSQAVATEMAANAAKESAEALLASERAWILVEIGESEVPKDASLTVWVTPMVTNRGKTPGKMIRTSIRSKFIPNPGFLSQQPDYANPVDAYFTLAPTVAIRPMKTTMPAQEVFNSNEGKGSLYIFGYMDYLDIGGTERKTRFAFRFYAPLLEGDVGPPGFYVSSDIPPIYNECT
jgi:hypothetical protein